MMKTLAAGLIPLSLVACATATPAPSTRGSRPLWAGESTRIDGVTVRFVGAENDSRCAPGQQCIREGEATVRLHVAEPGSPASDLRLLTSPPDSSAAIYTTHRVRLDSLSVRPSGSARYRAWVSLWARQ
jgi:hypothetical protein